MLPKTIKTVLVKFKNKISKAEIPYLRRATIHTDACSGVLFHNHIDNRLRYAYPLIQYRVVDDRGAIFFVEDAIAEIGHFLLSCEQTVNIGNRKTSMIVDSIEYNSMECGVSSDSKLYSIHDYLPLNQENYNRYLSISNTEEKHLLLERCICGNILSFGKSVGLFFDQQIKVKIKKIEQPKNVTYKGVSMLSFNIEFVTNVLLPQHIGLGKGVSLGKGVVELLDFT